MVGLSLLLLLKDGKLLLRLFHLALRPQRLRQRKVNLRRIRAELDRNPELLLRSCRVFALRNHQPQVHARVVIVRLKPNRLFKVLARRVKIAGFVFQKSIQVQQILIVRFGLKQPLAKRRSAVVHTRHHQRAKQNSLRFKIVGLLFGDFF